MLNKKNIVIFPYGGNAREALMTLMLNKNYKEYNFLGFIDDDYTRLKKVDNRIIGTSEKWNEFSKTSKLIALPGNSESYKERIRIIEFFKLNDSNSFNIISDKATVSPNCNIGFNSLIMHGCFISENVNIGNHCIILPNTVISHDVVIDDYTLIGSNVSLSGYVHIGLNSYIGSGSSIIGGVRVGSRSLIGLGSTVINNVDDDMKVAGNPAKKI